jgi:hypothetical protein
MKRRSNHVSKEKRIFGPFQASHSTSWPHEKQGLRVLRLSVCSTIPVFDDLQLLQDPFEQFSSGSAIHRSDSGSGLMNTRTIVRKAEKSLLEKLADRVQELHLKAQASLPIDRTKVYAAYREAFLAHRAHKIFIVEQDARLLAAGR